MARRPRETQFDGREPIALHCVSTCVRRYALLGRDPVTGIDRSHRRAWAERRLRELAEVFAIDVAAYAILENHLHLLLRLRPDVAATWAAEEVVDRWLAIAGRSLSDHDRKATRQALLRQSRVVDSLRWRLAHPADFHRLLKQPLAVLANREDGTRGSFWSGRYGCFPVMDEAHLLAVKTYIDLNHVRAGIVRAPEEARFSSIRVRTLVMRQAMANLEAVAADASERGETAEGVGASAGATGRGRRRASKRRSRPARRPTARDRVRLEDVAEHVHGRPQDLRHPEDGIWLATIEPREGSPGLLPGLTLKDYLAILDEVGRRVDPRKRGRIPDRLADIFERLAVDPDRLADAIASRRPLRGSVHGGPDACWREAARLGRRSIRPALDVAPRPTARGEVEPTKRLPRYGFGSDFPVG